MNQLSKKLVYNNEKLQEMGPTGFGMLTWHERLKGARGNLPL